MKASDSGPFVFFGTGRLEYGSASLDGVADGLRCKFRYLVVNQALVTTVYSHNLPTVEDGSPQNSTSGTGKEKSITGTSVKIEPIKIDSPVLMCETNRVFTLLEVQAIYPLAFPLGSLVESDKLFFSSIYRNSHHSPKES